MKRVRVRISAGGREGEIHPVYGVLANAPYVEYATAIQWNFTDEELGILHYVEGDPDRFEAALRSIPEVLAHEIECAGDRSFYAYVRDDTTPAVRKLWDVAARRSVVSVPPVEYRPDGSVTFSMVGPSEELQAGIDSVPDPVTVTVEEITGLGAMPRVAATGLTERQRAAVEAAIDEGYYEVPRTGSQRDVAERLDCAPSTAAEHLQKAEAALVRAAFA
ncbi:helix-turn-helix domain-containing protein [Halostella sp. JP-L12]|uniref:helix-turn-helix domain-containing protein n=1 Tax=Halostella TaxID=1843185 RepID=UPI000EF816CA|nr:MULTISPECIES: helix-turn-helix domain-containing protein [Halostella]NHN47255.1 helix-turn-helix domain-containing protein [Halostella sp. JP-L12]